MYRVYAQAFFVTSILLVIVILFKPGESFPFLGEADFYLFLVTTLLYFSFPIALVGRYLLKAGKLAFQVKIGGVGKILGFLKSKAVRLISNVFGFLLVLLVCTLFVWFLMRGFGKFVSRPFFDALTKFFVRNTVQQTLDEMDFYTTRSTNQGDFEELRKSLESFSESSEQVKDYFQEKEFKAFLEKGAREEIVFPYGFDKDGDEVKLEFRLFREDPFPKNTSVGIGEFVYLVYHVTVENGKEVYGMGPAFSFRVKSSDDPKLNLERFKVPNETKMDVLVVWWNSGELKKYAIFGPTGEIADLRGSWEINCFAGCGGCPELAEQRPSLVVSENEKTGETEYIIKTGEYRGPHLINYDYAGYAVTVNELGGLDVERLEFRR